MHLEIPSHLENYIGGAFVAPQQKKYFDNYNPATAELLCAVPDSTQEDVDAAVLAAKKAFPSWSNTAAEQRFLILNKIAALIDEHLDVLALAETNDNGKPLTLSTRVDIPRASSNFRFFATGLMHFASESHSMEDKAINYTLRQPIGVVGCISPWNLTL